MTHKAAAIAAALLFLSGCVYPWKAKWVKEGAAPAISRKAVSECRKASQEPPSPELSFLWVVSSAFFAVHEAQIREKFRDCMSARGYRAADEENFTQRFE